MVSRFTQVLSLVCLASLAVAAAAIDQRPSSVEDNDLQEEGRFGFINLNSDGATVTFNSTSLQYSVLAAVVLALVALVVVPAIGLTFGFGGNKYSGSAKDDYDSYFAYDQQGTDYSSYSNYAKRSLEVLSPVLTALSEAYRKYE